MEGNGNFFSPLFIYFLQDFSAFVYAAHIENGQAVKWRREKEEEEREK
jgi:hypothetical protein